MGCEERPMCAPGSPARLHLLAQRHRQGLQQGLQGSPKAQGHGPPPLTWNPEAPLPM